MPSNTKYNCFDDESGFPERKKILSAHLGFGLGTVCSGKRKEGGEFLLSDNNTNTKLRPNTWELCKPFWEESDYKISLEHFLISPIFLFGEREGASCGLSLLTYLFLPLPSWEGREGEDGGHFGGGVFLPDFLPSLVLLLLLIFTRAKEW